VATIIKEEIAAIPNMSNKQSKQLMSVYIKSQSLTDSIMRNARLLARLEVFGNPSKNVQYVKALVQEMSARHHPIIGIEKNAKDVLQMLERIVLGEEIMKHKASGILMTREEKMLYMMKWKTDHGKMLLDGGLGTLPPGCPVPSFVSGVLFTISASKKAVPHLQQVFQADAAHMSFGEYALYSCYGMTANCNTYPVDFGILFGNECKEGWMQYWSIVKYFHPTMNDYCTTIKTDQAKGLTEAIKEVLPEVGNFLCSFHRQQNIIKIFHGGTQMYSCHWMYNQCMNAKNVIELEATKIKHAPHIDNKALKYLNSIKDTE
jgi:hypothetical protein